MTKHFGILSAVGITLCGVLAVIFTVPLGQAQVASTGTITGTVSDSSGAAVPGVSISVTNQNTGVQTTTTSNAVGEFVVPALLVGVYTVEATKTGFATYSQTGIELHAATVTPVNPILQAGSVQTKVTVMATSTAVQTSTPEVSTEISGEQVFDAPLNGRNFQTLVTLLPGAVNTTPDSALPQGGFQAVNVISINGMGSASPVFYVDGVFSMNGATPTIQPNPDTIQEVNVLQNNYGVQYNLQGTQAIIIETKSGTDQFHGTAFEYLRNTDLNARNFFAAASTIQHQNIFGGTLGGPLYPFFLPGHRPKNPKTFFFSSIQVALVSNASTLTGATPTAAMRQGNFSTAITNPATGQPFPNAGGVYTIPSAMLNTNSLALLNASAPLPNYVSPTGGITNYINVNPLYTRTRDDEWKVDHDFNSRWRLMAEYAETRQINTSYPYAWTTITEPEPSETQTGTVRVTTSITPSMVNTAQIATSQISVSLALGGIDQVSQVPGFSENLPYKGAINSQYLPTISLSQGWSTFGAPGSIPAIHSATLNEQAGDDWSYLRGHHYIQAGFNLWKDFKHQNSGSGTNGSWSFSGQFTGSAVADYLIGDAASFSQGSGVNHIPAWSYQVSPYIQDQWKATRRLTITAGLRWIAQTGFNLPVGLGSIFNPALYNPADAPIVNTNGTITPTASYSPTNGLEYGGKNGVPQDFIGTQYYWYPSGGFAWDVFGDGKTALRGGWGINSYYQAPQTYCSLACAANPPIITTLTLVTPSFPNPIGAAATASAAPTLSSMGLKDRVENTQSFSLGLQHEFAGSWFTSIAGAGSLTRHMPGRADINQPIPEGGYDFNPILNTGTVFEYQYGSYPGYAGILTLTPGFNANWYGLEINVRHPVGHGLSFTASYTYQHDLTVTSGATFGTSQAGPQSTWFPERDYGNAQENVPQTFGMGYVYNLPWFRSTPGWSQVLGGWRFAGLTSLQSGFSLSPSLAIAHAGLATRPNAIAAVAGPKSLTQWFNTAAFAAPVAGYFGNSSIGVIHGPGAATNDMALYKDFHFTERHKLEFRAEAFNAFNRVNWNGVSTAFGSGTFGRVTSARDPRIFEFALRYQF